MNKIIPFLWFDHQTEEAVDFYTSVFKNSSTGIKTYYNKIVSKESGMPEGSLQSIDFKLENMDFSALNGGSMFKFTPAISFYVNCRTEEEVNELWKKLVEGGEVLMELNKYDFSERYRWLVDKYGVSWQLTLSDKAGNESKIIPCLMFVVDQSGKAHDAIQMYTSMFQDSEISLSIPYELGEDDPELIKHARFRLNGQDFAAMDSSLLHNFTATPAISFLVNCETQDEIDMFWDRLSKDGTVMQCGWVTDKYGITWQIVPSMLNDMLLDKDQAKSQRVWEEMLKMIKLDIEKLRRAYLGMDENQSITEK